MGIKMDIDKAISVYGESSLRHIQLEFEVEGKYISVNIEHYPEEDERNGRISEESLCGDGA